MSKKITLLFISLSFIFTSLPVNSKIFFLEADYYQDKTQERKITIGKGEIISSDKPISRVAVSDPDIADLQILNEKQVFARGKKLGLCTFLLWETGKTNPARFDVSVRPNIENLFKQLKELDENIAVEYIPPSSTTPSGESAGTSTPASGGAPASGSAPPSGNAPAISNPQAISAAPTSSPNSGRIILKGEVENAEIIARALQIAGAYVGDQGIRIISQPGGQVVNGLSGSYNIDSNSDSLTAQASQGSATSFGARNPISFTTNRHANLSRGVIATTQNGSVISFLRVKDPPQIAVAIRFYEISRTVARNLGFNTNFGGSSLQGGTFIGGDAISMTIGTIAGGSLPQETLGQGITGVIFNPNNGISVVIQALQERGEIKTLAEPNLVIANGEPASFLAGGEVPILRSVFTAGGASTDVTYEPFGIKFNLLPTVTRQNKVFLQLLPEIRDIDNELSNFVAPPGSTTVRPPAFRTRRTQTQVELESGQAFAISGLLREDNTRNLRKVPGIGDVPILGSLFRSKSFRKGESELLIVVSPQIIKPTDSNKIAKLSVPEVPYNDFDQFAPMKPYIKKGDEKGPELKPPIDAGKYNPSSENESENTSENNSDANVRTDIKATFPPAADPPLAGKPAPTAPITESSDLSKTIDRANDTLTKIQIEEKQKIIKKNNSLINLFRHSKAESTEFKDLNKEEQLAFDQKQAEITAYQEVLKNSWEQEYNNYLKAKETMKLARENKL